MQCPANVRTLSSDHGPVSIETLHVASEEYAAVAAQLLRTMPAAEVVTIEKVRNQSIEERYNFRKSQMQRRNQNLGDGAPHEQMMWHGTRATAPAVIYRDDKGFDMRHSRAGIWGEGTYFADNALYSHKYSFSNVGQRLFQVTLNIAGGAAANPGGGGAAVNSFGGSKGGKGGKGGKGTAGLPIPLFREVLASLPKGVCVLVEIKNTSPAITQELVEKTDVILKEYPELTHRILWFSLHSHTCDVLLPKQNPDRLRIASARDVSGGGSGGRGGAGRFLESCCPFRCCFLDEHSLVFVVVLFPSVVLTKQTALTIVSYWLTLLPFLPTRWVSTADIVGVVAPSSISIGLLRRVACFACLSESMLRIILKGYVVCVLVFVVAVEM
jgi:hypothetical protein